MLLVSHNERPNDRALFIQVVPPLDAQEDWHICVQLAIVAWNPENPSQFEWRNTSQRFERANQEAGFETFYDPDLRWPGDSHLTGELGSAKRVNLTAYVRVIEDISGRLWKTVKDYDTRLQYRYTGIRNQGATGYMQFILLNLFHIRACRKVCAFWDLLTSRLYLTFHQKIKKFPVRSYILKVGIHCLRIATDFQIACSHCIAWSSRAFDKDLYFWVRR
jgi:hypothetical protein